MADSTIELRLVRCPKCKNLLQEPRDCSFFQCGGCGSVLCAKNKDREADAESVEHRAKETQDNSGLSEEESDSDASLRHQRNGGTEIWDAHSDPSSKLNGNNDHQSGLDRLRQRTTKRSDAAIDKDRAGMVRKLDKLKEELVPPEEQQIPSLSAGFEEAPLRLLSSRRHSKCPNYYQYYPEPESPCHYNNSSDVSLHGPMLETAYGDPLGFQMDERALQPSHTQYSRRYGHDLFDTYPRNRMFHQSNCSCFHCYDPYHRASGSVFPPSGLPDALHNARIIGFGSSLHSPRTFIPPADSHSCGLQFHGRCQGDSGDAQKYASSRVRPIKARSSSACARLIKPLAGGAPFITCKNCSNVLKLPDKTESATRKQQRLRCGACSCLIDISSVDNKLVLSTDPVSARKEETHSGQHCITSGSFSSDDYANDAYEFCAMDKGQTDVSTGPALVSEKAQDELSSPSVVSTSPSVSEDELSSDSPTARRVTLDLPTSINVRDRSGLRSRSTRPEINRFTLSKTVMRQNSMNQTSVAIEMDVNDYCHNSEVSQDSANDYRDDQGRNTKGGFQSIVKNSFEDLKKSIQNGSDVSINGNLVAEDQVKMAEKQAGPIRPGSYWYDYRAGFWGVMGGHCLGILPPFIEELNYPMPKNCAGGTTRVFVNGRELHQKDLRLLTARGLPRDRDRSYTVYISGRVIDEDTGEELHSLGKLAPTVDKLKRGFGMRVPRRAA